MKHGPNRRQILTGSGAIAMLAGVPATAADDHERIDRDQRRYLGYGMKRAGGAGDNQVGRWLEEELAALGYAITRQRVMVPFFDADRATLQAAGTSASILPQPIVVATPAAGITAPLVRVAGNGVFDRSLAGAIALVDLPHSRWSSAVAKPVQGPVTTALAAGARAAVLVTNGPTGEALALNADGRKPMFDRPVAVLAPDDAGPFFAAAAKGAPATMTVAGRGGRRPATNFVARLARGHGSWLVVSTPRSGWFTCAAERGSGIAAWLSLARWAPTAFPDHNLAFVCNTGHEYEYLGSEEALTASVPKPGETAAWLHLGANVAARDWHEFGSKLLPLTTADPQRYLAVSPTLLGEARRAFAGQAGFASPYPVDQVAAGEIVPIVAAGYRNVAGTFGAHRFHHATGDDERCLVTEPVASAVAGFKTLLAAMAAG